MTPAARDRRILEALTAADALLRATVGNPHHDADGKFTSAGGEGHHHGPGKHHARNARRRRKLRALRRRHRAERRDHLRYERSERASLAREHARDRKALDREHASSLRRHEKTAPARHARVDAEHARKAERIGKGEAHAKAVAPRHERERAEFEQEAGQHGHLHAANERLYESQRKALRDRGGSPEDHAALEHRIAEHRETFADPHAGLRQSMDERHGRERQKADAFLAKSGTLKERLNRQTAAKHRRIDRTPERLERRRAADKAEMEGRHAGEREEQRERHHEERGEIRARQRAERARVRGKGQGDGGQHADTGARSLELHAGGPVRSGPMGPGSLRGVGGGQGGKPARLHPGRTHKASSAESILRHCLRRLGLTAAWKRGELTDRERLELLAEIRDYGRAWLRHEAEQLIRHYGRAVDGDDSQRTLRAGGSGLQGDLRRQDGGSVVGGASGEGEATHHGGSVGDLREDHHRSDARTTDGPEGDHLLRALAGRLRHRVTDFFQRVRGFLKEAIVAGALALSGGDLDDQDHAEIDRQHAVQVAFLDNFRRDIELKTPEAIAEPSGLALVEPMTAAQFIARAEQYGASIWGAGQAVAIGASIRSGASRIRRVHVGSDVPCQMCQDQQALGWMPVGDPRFIPIGQCTCMVSCHCHAELEWPDGTIKWAGGRKAA